MNSDARFLSRSRACIGWPDGPAGRCLNILVLQGGGALGAYHLGVADELAQTGLNLDWVAGISIGAINAALIAGNRPGQRIAALEAFWTRISSGAISPFPVPDGPFHTVWATGAAMLGAACGVPGFFSPRLLPPVLQPANTPEAISYYDTAPLYRTLDELVDWDLLNDGPVRLSVGAVSATTGRLHFFDSKGGPDHTRIGAAHIIASGALPPAFPPVEIDGDWYWDGGLASNAPIQHVLDESTLNAKNIFQVDLFPAEGDLPGNLLDTLTRMQDIRFSSRTRLGTNIEMALSPLRQWVRTLLDEHQDVLTGLDTAQRRMLENFADDQHVEIAQIIYRDKAFDGGYDGQARGFEFSRPTMEAHRAAGRRDAQRVLALRDWSCSSRRRGVHSTDPGAPIRDPAGGRRRATAAP